MIESLVSFNHYYPDLPKREGSLVRAQYCESQKLRRYSSSGTHMPSTGNTFTREQRLLVEEIPGYSEPLLLPLKLVGVIILIQLQSKTILIVTLCHLV